MSGLTLSDEFAGAGGSTQGAAAVPGVAPIFAANHNATAVETHAANFPAVDHFLGDVVAADITRFPRSDLHWASPACPPWTDARGKKRDFDRSTWQALPGFDDDGPDEQTMRARALMEEIPRYLRHWADCGRPVLAGVVENVIQCRKWDQWSRWLGEIRRLGYDTRVIALNSMHARPVRTLAAPQSRDRLYVAYWLRTLDRAPDWDKWLRPRASCPSCDQVVDAVQVFKNPESDMGRYGPRGQYLYRCPRRSCRGQVVEPDTLPALVAIDWTLTGVRIGDRPALGMEPLKPNTLARIEAGLRRYASPTTPPAPVELPSLLVPVEGRPGKTAVPVDRPGRTQTARNETGLAVPPQLAPAPFLVPLRGGGEKGRARRVDAPLTTVAASGNHHGLATPPAAMVMRNNSTRGDIDAGWTCTGVDEPVRTMTAAGHQSLVSWGHLLVPYNRTGVARRVTDPLGVVPTRDRWALAAGDLVDQVDVDDVLFRMLTPPEIGRAMAFGADYVVRGTSNRVKVRQYGNAVTPPAAEVIVSALVEAITGEPLDRELPEAA